MFFENLFGRKGDIVSMEGYLLFGFLGLWGIMHGWHLCKASMRALIVSKWIRWLLFAYIVGQLSFVVEWTGRPSWVISLTAFIGWFIVETVFYYLGIQSFNKSNLPLFPQFKEKQEQISWPAQKFYIKEKNWIHHEGYKKVKTLVCQDHPLTKLQSAVYHSLDNKTRLQVVIGPSRILAHRVFYIFTTKLETGEFFITDNYSMPFGGFYPPKWSVLRRPLIKSIAKLEGLHFSRLPTNRGPIELKSNVLADLRWQYKTLEDFNVSKKFILPLDRQQECGRISKQGCYRIWKQMWLINYVGLAPGVRYAKKA